MITGGFLPAVGSKCVATTQPVRTDRSPLFLSGESGERMSAFAGAGAAAGVLTGAGAALMVGKFWRWWLVGSWDLAGVTGLGLGAVVKRGLLAVGCVGVYLLS